MIVISNYLVILLMWYVSMYIFYKFFRTGSKIEHVATLDVAWKASKPLQKGITLCKLPTMQCVESLFCKVIAAPSMIVISNYLLFAFFSIRFKPYQVLLSACFSTLGGKQICYSFALTSRLKSYPVLKFTSMHKVNWCFLLFNFSYRRSQH